MLLLDRAFETARKKNYKIVFPERDDQRIFDAAKFLTKEKLAKIVWLENTRITSSHLETIKKQRPNIKENIAEKLLMKPLYLAGAILSLGQADAMIAGVMNPTKRVIEAASLTVGISKKLNHHSSYFLMVSPNGSEYIFADCAVNSLMSEEILHDISISAAAIAEKLLGYAKLALLSFSTLASGEGETVRMVRNVTESLTKKGIQAYGPIQADAALSREIAEMKGIEHSGDLNVLIFPSLDAGNIAYKLCQSLGNFKSIGPFLQGFNKPVCDLSRGATTEDIISASVLTLASI